MAIGVDVVLVRFAQRADPIFESRPAVAKYQPRRQTLLVILARHDMIAATFGEETEPCVEIRDVEQRAVCGEEIVQREAVAK